VRVHSARFGFWRTLEVKFFSFWECTAKRRRGLASRHWVHGLDENTLTLVTYVDAP